MCKGRYLQHKLLILMIDRLLSDPNKTFREGLDIEVEEVFPLACPLVPHATQFA
jgi:hypothetical protein